jgi:hypothetical protein
MIEYKNKVIGKDNKLEYYFGWQMNRTWKKVSKKEYESSNLNELYYN